MKHLRYLRYVLKHKWFVFYAGLKTGAPLRALIIHDWSKFTKEEWFPYVENFYGGERTPEVKTAFRKAFRLHASRNPHHWQYWSEGRSTPERIPDPYVREMVADWMGAGRAITGSWDLREWYAANKEKQQLNPYTRAQVEALIAKVKI